MSSGVKTNGRASGLVLDLTHSGFWARFGQMNSNNIKPCQLGHHLEQIAWTLEKGIEIRLKKPGQPFFSNIRKKRKNRGRKIRKIPGGHVSNFISWVLGFRVDFPRTTLVFSLLFFLLEIWQISKAQGKFKNCQCFQLIFEKLSVTSFIFWLLQNLLPQIHHGLEQPVWFSI